MENLNPYNYKGPLDPINDKIICIPRKKEVEKIIRGLLRGEYWAVIGPRQVGKTTLLRQIETAFPQAYCVYMDLELSSSENNLFYRSLIEEFQKRIPSHAKLGTHENWGGYGPELDFLNFLENFQPKDNKKKVFLFFDEIGKISFISNFLHLWRKVYHERYYKKGLNRYSVVLTGSVDLIPLTKGANSPFNIAENLYIEDFSEIETLKLIKDPLEGLKIEIEQEAQDELVSLTSGHPQLIQHLCHILVDCVLAKKEKIIKKKHIAESIPVLFRQSPLLETLKQQFKINNILEDLLRDTLEGEKKLFFPNKEYSIAGAGAIKEKDLYCSIRNEIFKEFIVGLLDDSKYRSLPPSEKKLLKLNNKIEAELAKINEYEEKVLYDNDLLFWKVCERELKLSEKQSDQYKADRESFSKQSGSKNKEIIKNIDNILKKLFKKIDDLKHLLKQKCVHYHFLDSETFYIIADTLKFLSIDELTKMDMVIGSIASGKVEEIAAHHVLSEVHFIISQINAGKISFTHHALLEKIKKLEEETKAIKDLKLVVMLHLPIIPLLLANKHEIRSENSNIDIDLKELEKKWKILVELITKK